jgi:Holliday junction resolvase
LLGGETVPTIRQEPPNKQAKPLGGKRSRQKGDRAEREIVAKHIELGIHAERYPLSGASRFRGSGHDLDIYAFGKDEAPLVAEVKARKSGGGFVQLEKWLGEFDALFLRRNNADPLIVVPWRVWAQLLKRVRP